MSKQCGSETMWPFLNSSNFTVPCVNSMVITWLSLNPHIFVENGFFEVNKNLKDSFEWYTSQQVF